MPCLSIGTASKAAQIASKRQQSAFVARYRIADSDWFNETTLPVPVGGFPEGTLLIISRHEKDILPSEMPLTQPAGHWTQCTCRHLAEEHDTIGACERCNCKQYAGRFIAWKLPLEQKAVNEEYNHSLDNMDDADDELPELSVNLAASPRFFDLLRERVPAVFDLLDHQGCWDYRIYAPDSDGPPVLTVHLSTGQTARIKTYAVVWDLIDNRVSYTELES